ncbi:MAG: riboflavin synthase [Planctomycetes bacterium]|nr:riboflavin synthase [Planctomycetota bacterium]
MFTGIIESALPLLTARDEGGVRSLSLDLSSLQGNENVKLGDSVALNGCCLTVAGLKGAVANFQAIPETLRLTNLGDLQPGALVNVERAMQAGARFDGHFVQGHVDGVGDVAAIDDLGGEWRVRIACGREFADHCIPKGSVCLDGISLTIAELHEDSIVVAIIPHTRQVTNIRAWAPGTRVNLEADMIGKYVRRQLQQQTQSNVDENLLRRAGFVS